MSTVTLRSGDDGYLAVLVDGKLVLSAGLDDGLDLSEKPLSANSIVSATVQAVARALGAEVQTERTPKP